MAAVKNILPKTKILFFAILLILLPGAILSYLGYRSIQEKAQNLQTNYQGTVSLLRDKLEREVVQMEEAARTSLNSPFSGSASSLQPQEWLRKWEAQNPGLRRPFFLNRDGGVISSAVSFGWFKSTRQTDAGKLMPAGIQDAETAEFVRRDFEEAIRTYRKILSSLRSDGRALLLGRIGRCYFKLGRYREGIAEYEKMLKLAAGEITTNGIPHRVIALSQIADGYAALNEPVERGAATLQLYETLLDQPWDLEGGSYLYYLKSAGEGAQGYTSDHPQSSSAQRQFASLKKRESEVLEHIRYIQFVHHSVAPQIQTGPRKGTSDLRPNHLSEQFGEAVIQLGYFRLAESSDTGPVALGYQIAEDFVASKLLPRILQTVDLGKDLLVGVLDEKESIRYAQQNNFQPQPSKYLAAENFSEIIPAWKVALFHREGKTLEELIGREKKIYLTLFLGIVLVMVIGIVVTARAAAHEVELSRMKSEFVSNVSHELKTPLALIRMFGETLETGLVQDESKRQEFYRIIRKESERLSHLINNVLDFSKMDAGSKEYHFEEDDVVEVVRSTLEAYRFHIRDLGFEMVSRLPDEPIIARIDKDAISQALLNLLSNATSYSEERKYISVAVKKNTEWLHVSVEDHGVGIAKEEFSRIFEKFYRVGAGNRNTRGSGLGLTLVKHVVEAHGGKVAVKSAKGEGTIFTLSLPVWKES